MHLNNEQDNVTGTNHAGNKANQPLKLLTASSIQGNKIFNNEGEDLGKIMDLMLNLHDGTIQYVIIEFGGFMGFARKYFAVPFDTLTIDEERHAFILDQSLESFKNNPGFDKEHWPESNSHWERSRFTGSFMGPNTGSDH